MLKLQTPGGQRPPLQWRNPMKVLTAILVITLSSLLLTAAGQLSPAPPPLMPMVTMSGLLRLVQTIPLPSEGYIDHLAIDVKGQRLFIAGEANKTLIVVGLREGKVIHATEGLTGNPRKPLYVSETNEIWTDLSDNTVVAISGTTYAVTKTVELTGGRGAAGREPDNGAYDPIKHLYYVAIVTRPGT